MELEKIIGLVISEGKSLTRNEREKAAGPYDEVYINEKIEYHTKRVNMARGVLALIFITIVLALCTVLYYENLSPVSQLWLKGTLIVLTVLCILGMPILLKNHSRNASVLRLVRAIRQSEREA